MINYASLLRATVGCVASALFTWLAWVDLHGLARGAVIGGMLISVVLFILTALREWQVGQAVADVRFERTPAPIDEDFDEEPFFDLPPRVFGKEW